MREGPSSILELEIPPMNAAMLMQQDYIIHAMRSVAAASRQHLRAVL